MMQIFYFYLVSGLILIIMEIAVSSFYLCVIGVVLILSGFLGLLIHNWLITGALSVSLAILACLLLSYYKGRVRQPAAVIIERIGHLVEVVEVKPDCLRIKYSGSFWDAKLADKDLKNIKVGDSLTITAYHNNEFEVEKRDRK